MSGMTNDTVEPVKQDVPPVNTGDTDNTKELTALSDRDIKWRAKYKVTRDELETIKVEKDKEIQVVSEKVNILEKVKVQAEQKWIQAEVKAEAIAAGIKDIDFIKLMDLSNIKPSEDGKIAGLKEAVEAFKAQKPTCFGSADEGKRFSSSTNAAVPPVAVAPQKKSAYDYTAEEYAAKRSQFLRGKFD